MFIYELEVIHLKLMMAASQYSLINKSDKFKFTNFPFERGEILFSKGFFDFRIFVNYKTKLKLHIL